MDVVVIGAGQAGLAAAYHLRRVGLVPVDEVTGPAGPRTVPTFVVLDDAPAPGGAWQHRRPSLTMATVHGVHDLPGRSLPDADPDASASDVVAGYFADYEDAFDLRVRRPVRVRAVRDLGGPDRLLAVETDETGRADGTGEPGAPRVGRTWRTRSVVNATGTWSKPFWPTYPGRDRFEGRQLHESELRSPDELAGQRVIVVGGGTSAVQLLLQLVGVATTTWVTRRPPQWFEADELTPELGREAVALVDARTRAGLVPESVVAVTGLPLTPAYRAGIASGVLVSRPMFARLVPRGAAWTVGSVPDGTPTHVRADAVVWATGFRAALDHLAPLHLRTRGGGLLMDGTRSVDDPRIQLVGYGPSASTIGANRAGREAVRHLRRTLGL